MSVLPWANLPLQVLDEAFDSTPANRPMFELARRLKPACRVAIITDNKLDRMQRLIALQRLGEQFDPVFVSAAHGCSKSSRALFDRALAIARCRLRDPFSSNERTIGQAGDAAPLADLTLRLVRRMIFVPPMFGA